MDCGRSTSGRFYSVAMMSETGAWSCYEADNDVESRCGNRGSCPSTPPPRKTLRVSRSSHRSHSDYDDER